MERDKAQLKWKDLTCWLIVQPCLGIAKSESSDENICRFLIYAFSRAFYKQVEMNIETENESSGDSMSSYFGELNVTLKLRDEMFRVA